MQLGRNFPIDGTNSWPFETHHLYFFIFKEFFLYGFNYVIVVARYYLQFTYEIYVWPKIIFAINI